MLTKDITLLLCLLIQMQYTLGHFIHHSLSLLLFVKFYYEIYHNIEGFIKLCTVIPDWVGQLVRVSSCIPKKVADSIPDQGTYLKDFLLYYRILKTFLSSQRGPTIKSHFLLPKFLSGCFHSILFHNFFLLIRISSQNLLPSHPHPIPDSENHFLSL